MFPNYPNSNSNPRLKPKETEKLPHINDEIARRKKLEIKLENYKLQQSLLDSSLNSPKPGKRKTWDAEMTVFFIALRNNERCKGLFAKNDRMVALRTGFLSDRGRDMD